MPDHARQQTLFDRGLDRPLTISLNVTLDPSETGWGALNQRQAVECVVEALEELGPGVSVQVVAN